MKIVMFQYNKAVSAIIQMNSMVDEQQGNQCPVTNRFLANGYEDRLLWEEATNLKPKPSREYCIPGTWQ